MKNTLFKIPNNWGIVCLLNLCIASLLGIIMRYKMVYPLPWINQSNVIHAHSHFVFQGWASLVLICLFISLFLPFDKRNKKAYFFIFWIFQITAFGMLFTFIVQGYAFWSILFSALSQFVFYWFAVQYFLDMRHSKKNPFVTYFSFAAIISFILASLGPYFLAYYSTTGVGSPLWTRGALYFYLHFQYNGWFSFAIFALFFEWLERQGIHFNQNHLKRIFLLLVVGIIPGYSLSLIGYLDNIWVYICAYFAIITQLIAIGIFIKVIFDCRKDLNVHLSPIQKLLWGTALLALVSKSILQAISLNPSLAIVAFSLRPLVIGYLHLIFICMLSYFIIGFLIGNKQLTFNGTIFAKLGLLGFFCFSIMSEILLFLQAYGYYFSVRLAFVPVSLFYVTVLMTFSLFIYLIGQRKRFG